MYWKDECKFCKNRNDCEYKKTMIDFKEALSYMEKCVKGIYGSLRFYCDYFVVDEEEYWKNNVGEIEYNEKVKFAIGDKVKVKDLDFLKEVVEELSSDNEEVEKYLNCADMEGVIVDIKEEAFYVYKLDTIEDIYFYDDEIEHIN